ncbi:hypothetical protein V2E39_13390 [Chryseobacterium arthrosphaerae]|uniref:Phage tail collar domain-containing protein n=1 Tax=Chryseobacterium arthrosphaerae TaxID=651561 RepID=A0ABU7R0N5_9FLAO|nr:hypothetical protein [Chryseobacterium arthrosphaerae]
MIKTKKTILSLLMMVSLNVFSQDCNRLLQDGLYSFTKMTKTESFGKDLRTYYLSETFKLDMRSGKWGGSLSIPIEGIPFSIGANDSEEKFTELRTKLLSVSELKVETNYVQVLLQSIPNTNLYEAYVKCVDINDRKGVSGFVQGTNIETEDAVVFTIYYRPSSPTDPMPKVTEFNVVPEGNIISGGLKVGDHLSGFTTLITCKRPLEKDLILTIQTDRGGISSKASAQDNFTSNKELPLGTIISSFLNFEQFNTVTKNNEKSPGGIWTSNKSKWAPADGRPVPNSKFQTLTSQTQVPDLRGMFLRGLNIFDPFQPVPNITVDKGDPDNRIVGSFQPDTFQGHRHINSDNLAENIGKESPNTPKQRMNVTGASPQNSAGKFDAGFGTPRISSETRPKNISVFYYIKIN